MKILYLSRYGEGADIAFRMALDGHQVRVWIEEPKMADVADGLVPKVKDWRPSVAWADPKRFEALRAQHSLSTLILLGERLQSDAAALLDRAAFDGEQIASASVAAEARFADEEERAAFLEEYVETTARLLERYGNKRGAPYRVVLAAYPDTERSES